MSEPRFTVIVLLPEARGLAEQCVRAWAAGQSFDRSRLEVVVVTDGREPGTEGRVAPLLGPGDRLLLAPGATRTDLFDRGARAARGTFVILTESHCVPDPTFLGELDRYLTDTGACGACCRGVPMCRDALGRVAAHCFEDGYRLYTRPDDWRKVNIHAFAIRRTAYLEAGGLNPRYGIFAEMILAWELWTRGHRAGYAERAVVRHQFDGSAAESAAFNADAVAGEMRYHHDHPLGPRIPHTFLADGDVPWSERELERAAFAALWAERRRGLLPAVRQGWRALKTAVREGRPGRAADRAALVLAAAGCRVIGSESALARRLYLKSWAAAARLARKEYLAAQTPEPRPAGAHESFAVTELPDRDLWGFHLLEEWEGRPVRWTRRCAVIRLPRPAGACELTLRTNGVGWPVEGRTCAVYADGRRVPDRDVSVEVTRIRVGLPDLPGRGPLVVATVCDPVPAAECGTAEPRELGFPLFGVEVRTRTAEELRRAA